MAQPRKRIFGPLFYSTLVLGALAAAYSGVAIHGPRIWESIEERRAVGSLAEGLRGVDPRSREASASALIRKGSEVALPHLIAAARDPDGAVRALACRSLVQMWADPGEVAPVLIAAAGDGRAEVRLEAARGLGRMAGYAPTIGAAPGRAGGLSAEVRAGSLSALRRLLKDPSAEVRAASADAIGEFDPDPKAATLVAAIPDTGRDNDSLAPRTTGPARPSTAGSPAPDPAAVADLVAANADDDRAVRLAAARALLKLNGTGDPVAPRALLALVADPEPSPQRRAALDLLRVVGDDAYDRALAALVALLGRDAVPMLRDRIDFADVIDCLQSAGPRAVAALPALEALWADEDFTLRSQAALAIATIHGKKSPRGLAILARIVADPTFPQEWRQNALDMIREVAPSTLMEATPGLVRQLGDRSPAVRRAALDLLSQFIDDTPAAMPGPPGGP